MGTAEDVSHPYVWTRAMPFVVWEGGRVGRVLAALVAVFAVAAGSAPAHSRPADVGASGPAYSGRADVGPSGSASPAPVGRVLAISVDGLAPAGVTELGSAGAPWLHRMMAHGASTLNARTAREATDTLPNHTGMVTGRRVLASAGGHGVDFNSDDGSTVHAAAGEHVPSVFAVVHDHGGSTALFAGKGKFAVLDRSWDEQRGADDRVGSDDGRDKIDVYVEEPDTELLVDRFVHRLRTDPATFAFLHLRLPDSSGHDHGFLSRPYLRAVRRTDALLGRVLSAVRAVPALRRSTTVVLTADHGGHRGVDSRSHADPRLRGNFRIPFVAWGARAAHGADLYRLNPDRRWPGVRRPTYAGRQPIRNADLANLVTDLLDLPPVAGSLLNRHQNLDVRSR